MIVGKIFGHGPPKENIKEGNGFDIRIHLVIWFRHEASSKVTVGWLQASDISAVCSEGKETKGKEYH